MLTSWSTQRNARVTPVQVGDKAGNIKPLWWSQLLQVHVGKGGTCGNGIQVYPLLRVLPRLEMRPYPTTVARVCLYNGKRNQIPAMGHQRMYHHHSMSMGTVVGTKP